jgi:FkbM family methyltransferase
VWRRLEPAVWICGSHGLREGTLPNLSAISNNTLFGKLLRAPLRLIPRSAVVPILQGPLRGKRWIVGSGHHGCWLGSYEHDKQEAFRNAIKKGDVVYDVGANVGFYTLLASVLTGDAGYVYAFEPLPGNLRDLRRHLELNRVSNCAVIEAAVSIADGEALFDPSGDRYTAHLSAGGTSKVRTVALDTLVSRKEIRPPALMKIDIEGEELRCLTGCRNTLQMFRPAIFLATHGREIHEACVQFLSELHYKIVPVGEGPLERMDELLAHREDAPA